VSIYHQPNEISRGKGRLARLWLPTGTALAFALVLYACFLLNRRNEQMLELVEHGHYPNVETSNVLLDLRHSIQRGLYDAVSASDPEALPAIDRLYLQFQNTLTSAEANPVADRKRIQALREAMGRYYPQSRVTSERMIRGESFGTLAPELQRMKVMQSEVDALLQAGLQQDRRAITSAFASSRRIQKTTITTMACVVLVCHAALLIGYLLHSRLGATKARNEALQRHRQELEEQVAQRTTELRAILDSAGEGIFGLDENGLATFINPAAAQMLGWSIRELLGRDVMELIRCHDAPWSSNSGTSEFCTKDERVMPVEYTSRALVANDGGSHGVVVTFRDISERRAVERMKDEFVSTVSHELRTPLTSIRGALSILNTGLLSAERRQRLLSIATSNSERLSRLINDILDLERIGAGRATPQPTPVDAQGLLRQAAEGVQTMAEQVGVRVVVEPVEAALCLDADRIMQTLTNLLGNAIKFSPAGTTVALGGEVRDTDFLFRVVDQGRGIPQNQLERIFERFQQVDASDSRDRAGSGLGLAICRSIVEAHGGRIWAESDGNGSTFFFTIPWPEAMRLRSIS